MDRFDLERRCIHGSGGYLKGGKGEHKIVGHFGINIFTMNTSNGCS